MKNSPVNLLCKTDSRHKVVEGTVVAVADAVRRGADLHRFATYNLDGAGLVEETMTLQTTWIFDDENVGGLQTLRHPVNAGFGISMQPSIALWIFGVGVPQRCTFVPLDGTPMSNATGEWVQVDNDAFSAVKREFIPKQYQWRAGNDWEEVCAHDVEGNASRGSWQEVREAVNDGCITKVGIKNLWDYLGLSGQEFPEHEVFVECTTNFAHLEGKFLGVLTQPTFLLQPCVPLSFTGENFAFGWLVVRTDGKVQHRTLNPSSMKWEQGWDRHAVRWFVRC